MCTMSEVLSLGVSELHCQVPSSAHTSSNTPNSHHPTWPTAAGYAHAISVGSRALLELFSGRCKEARGSETLCAVPARQD